MTTASSQTASGRGIFSTDGRTLQNGSVKLLGTLNVPLPGDFCGRSG